MVAAVMGRVSCVAWLLDKGADPYATDGRGYTAAIRALKVHPFLDCLQNQWLQSKNE